MRERITRPKTALVWAWLLAWGLAAVALPACTDENPSADTGVNNTVDVGGDSDDVGGDEGDTGGEDTAPDVPEDTGENNQNNNNTNNNNNDPDTGDDADAPDRPDVDTEDADTDRPDVDRDLPPQVIDLSPTRGTVEGGTPILFIGADFTPDTNIQIGSRRVEQLQYVNREQMLGLAPPGTEGLADVKVSNPIGATILPGGFLYFTPLRAERVVPSRSSTSGGALVRLEGTGFDADTQVTIGGRAAIGVNLLDSRTIELLTPPAESGRQDVRVTNRNTSSLIAGGMLYYDTVEIERLFPATGPSAGGNTIRAFGRGFIEGTRVRLGELTVDAELIAPDELRFRAPAGPVGFADVTVFNDNGLAGLIDGYLYTDATTGELAVLGVSPAQGPAAGGTRVTIIGDGFEPGDVEVTIGGNPATVEATSPTTLVVISPEGDVGTADVTVTLGAERATLSDGFRYLDDLRITAVEPDSGPVEGGGEVVIRGAGFREGVQVRFGAVNAAVQTVGPDTITATAPPGPVGLVDVVVDRGDLRTRSADAYTYTSTIEVWGMTPTRGAVAGGTFVVFRGRGFVSAPAISFGRNAATEVTLIDASTITARAPEGREGIVDVTLDFGAGPVRCPDRYTYYNPGTSFGGVWGDPITGTVNVTVLTTNLAPIPNAFVMLTVTPTTPYRGYTNMTGQVTFSGADLSGEQTVTAVAAEHSSATVQSFSSENITVFLSPLVQGNGSPPPGPPLGTITGTITGVDKVAEPGPNEFELAIVTTTAPGLFEASPPPGNGNVTLGNGTYTLISRTGDVAVVGVAGLYNNATDVFTPYYMGVRRGLIVEHGQTYTVNLDMNIPLNRPIPFKLRGAPRGVPGPNMNLVLTYLDFGYEGVFQTYSNAQGNGEFVTSEHQPPLRDELADVTFTYLGGAWTDGGAPYSLATLKGQVHTDQIVELPELIGVPQPRYPAAGGRVVNNYVEFDPNSIAQPDFYYIDIRKPDDTPVWLVIVPGNEPFFQLPTFPDFSELPPEERPNPLIGGQLVMNVYSARAYEFDYDRFDFNDFSIDNWEAFAATAWLISLR